MKRYVALDGRGRSIITVHANSEREARARITQQLDRDGRRDFYRLWVESGRRVQVKEG